jgi:RNA polymerase sigma-70 factor (ECF subfamily)
MGTIYACPAFVYKVRGMSELAVSTTQVRPNDTQAEATGAAFVCAFNEVRAELVSTLFFVLGNQDDAQDAAQDAFMKCWRTRQSLGKVRNIRAWIFRVGLNAAKDLQRSAWRRRARPLSGAPEACVENTPVDQLADKEVVEQVRAALLDLRP